MSYFQQLMGVLAGGVVGMSTGWTAFKPLAGTPTLLTAGRTYTGMFTSRAPFTKAKLVFTNYNTAGTLTLVADCAASPTLNNTGAALTHIPVTVGGSTTIVVPAATTSADGQTVPGCVCSDEITVASVARTDTPGADPVFYYRVYSAGQLPSWTTNFNAGLAASAGRSGYGSSSYSGNAVGTQTAISQFGGLNNLQMVAEVMLYCPGAKSVSAHLYGDSISAGTPIDVSFTLDLFAKFSAAGFPNMSLANYAVGGSKRTTTSGTLRSVAPQALPELAILWDYTVNTGSATTPELDAQWTTIIDDIAFLKALGCKVALVTMHAGTGSAARSAHSARTRTYCAANDVMLIDIAAALADPGGSNGSILAAYQTDWTHLTTAGVQQGAGVAFLPAITAAL